MVKRTAKVEGVVEMEDGEYQAVVEMEDGEYLAEVEAVDLVRPFFF